MAKLEKVSVIVPAVNEEKTIGNLLKELLAIPLVGEIVVVDDGSTDRTTEIVADFVNKRKVAFIRHLKNQGKSASVVDGIKNSSGEIVIFLDADLFGIKPYHIKTLTAPVIEDWADMVIGIRFPKQKVNLAQVLNWRVSGQRAFRRKSLLPLLSRLKKLDSYEIEPFLNRAFGKKRTILVTLPGVGHLLKHQKRKPVGVVTEYLTEGIHIVKALARIRGLQRRERNRLEKEMVGLLNRYFKIGSTKLKGYFELE